MTSLPLLQPLTEWRPLPVLKTSAVLERGRAGGLPEGGLTVQLQAQNDRHMMSDIVSKSVVVGDNKPILTGEKEEQTHCLVNSTPFFSAILGLNGFYSVWVCVLLLLLFWLFVFRFFLLLFVLFCFEDGGLLAFCV